MQTAVAMEFPARGRSTAAVGGVGDGDEDGRRFPDPPPPHGRDSDSASADMAALVFRREQLLQELHRERIRHDMIMCELAETERVMTACLAGRAALCGRSLMTPWEEAMYRTSRSSEETSWWRRSPSGPAEAPVYPRVERSPSPMLQPRSVRNAEKQERDSSSRPLAVAPSVLPVVEQCPSLSKQPAVQEALVPAAANVVAKPAQRELLSKKEVALDSRGVADHEHESGLKDRCAVQLTQSGIQISEHLKRAAVDQEHKAEAKDTHAVQPMGCEIQRSEQPMHLAVGQEYRAEAKDCDTMQLMECEIKRSEHLKHVVSSQEREVDMNVRHTVQVMESKFRRSEQLKQGVVDQEHQAEVENNHEVKLTVSEIQRSEQQKRKAFGEEHEAEKDRHAMQLSKITEQPKPADPTIKDHTDDERRQLSHQYALPGKEKSPPNEQRRLVLNEPSAQITPSGVKGNQIWGPMTVETSPPKRQKPLEDWSCTYCKESLSCEQDLTRHQATDLHQWMLALHSRQEAAGLTTKSIAESSDHANLMVRPIRTNNFGKSEPQKPQGVFGFGMRNHSKHMSHQANTQTLHTNGWNHFSDRSHQESRQTLHTGGHGKEGNKHAADHMGTEDRKKFVTKRRLPFCGLCNVQCNSEKMMESHLGGKKHRENLQARQ